MGVSKNKDTPKSSILIGFSILNHPFWGATIFGNTYIFYRYQLFSIPSPRSNPKHPTSGSPPSQDERKVHLWPIIERKRLLEVCHVCTKTGSRVIHQNQTAFGETAKQWLQFAMHGKWILKWILIYYREMDLRICIVIFKSLISETVFFTSPCILGWYSLRTPKTIQTGHRTCWKASMMIMLIGLRPVAEMVTDFLNDRISNHFEVK